MGQTYSVILKTGFKDKEGAKKALLDRIAKGDEDHTEYSLDHYSALGINTDTVEDLMKILFGGWEGKLVPVRNHPDTLRSDFDACYGWEYILTVAFNDLAPFRRVKDNHLSGFRKRCRNRQKRQSTMVVIQNIII